MSSEVCICCGRPLEGVSIKAIGLMFYGYNRTVTRQHKNVRLTPTQMAMFECLLDGYPAPVSKEKIFFELYAHRLEADQPDSHHTISVQAFHLRRKLLTIGVDVISNWAGGYRLAVAA